MVGITHCAALSGVEGLLLTVEADASEGFPQFEMVGLLSSEVKEARERVRTAISNSGFELPVMKYTINLSPADIRKAGNYYDLPIAMAVLASVRLVDRAKIASYFIFGELSLEGNLRPVSGTLSFVIAARKNGFTKCIVPMENAKEAALIDGMEIFGFSTLEECVKFFEDGELADAYVPDPQDYLPEKGETTLDFSEIVGQENLKRAAGSDILRPKFAVMNPELTMSLPMYQTACGITDMFAHLCERYFSPTRDVALSDNLCEAIMRTVVEEGVKVMANPSDYQARANIMWAGTLAHNDVCGAGRVQDWASHGIEHELSALYDCAHGAGLAVVMPAWMTFVHGADDARFARFARNVFDAGLDETDAKAALDGIAAFRRWLKSLGMPLNFAELGAREEDIPLLVKTLNLNGNTLGAFKPLTSDDVAAIYRLCL